MLIRVSLFQRGEKDPEQRNCAKEQNQHSKEATFQYQEHLRSGSHKGHEKQSVLTSQQVIRINQDNQLQLLAHAKSGQARENYQMQHDYVKVDLSKAGL